VKRLFVVDAQKRPIARRRIVYGPTRKKAGLDPEDR
jgi:hypothetical protein